MRLVPHNYEGSVLLAVSGGIDSVVMAHVMCHDFVMSTPQPAGCPPRGDAQLPAAVPAGLDTLSTAWRRDIAVAHCNFGLRGEESDGDEAFVKEFAKSLGLRCFTISFETTSYAKEHGISIEMAARELRYRWFDQLCREHGFAGVCVAHNANDNAETLILNLLRGTGLRGACCMDFESNNPYSSSERPTKVYRPMLEASRADIEAYAREHSLSWREDSTNSVNDCKRNIIRNEIFPLFAKINPSFIRTLGRDIYNFRNALEEPSLSEKLVSCGFNHSTIRNVMECLDAGQASGKVFYSPTHSLVISGGELVFRKLDETPEPMPIKVELIAWKKGMSPKTEKGVTLLDAAKLGGEPVLRPWREGDWMRPIGLKGKKMVSDILKELKYDVLERRGVMVVESEGSHVAAIVGERVDESVKIDSHTSEVYKIMTIFENYF